MGILNFAKFSNQKGRARCGLTAEVHFTQFFALPPPTIRNNAISTLALLLREVHPLQKV